MLWLTIFGMGVITYLIRLSLMGLWEGVEITAVWQRALKFVPIAVLSAIILPEMVQPGGTLNISLENGRLMGGLIAILVAWYTKSLLWPVAVGMVVVWLWTWIL